MGRLRDGEETVLECLRPELRYQREARDPHYLRDQRHEIQIDVADAEVEGLPMALEAWRSADDVRVLLSSQLKRSSMSELGRAVHAALASLQPQPAWAFARHDENDVALFLSPVASKAQLDRDLGLMSAHLTMRGFNCHRYFSQLEVKRGSK